MVKARKPDNQETKVEGSALTEQSIQLQPMKYKKIDKYNPYPIISQDSIKIST